MLGCDFAGVEILLASPVFFFFARLFSRAPFMAASKCVGARLTASVANVQHMRCGLRMSGAKHSSKVGKSADLLHVRLRLSFPVMHRCRVAGFLQVVPAPPLGDRARLSLNCAGLALVYAVCQPVAGEVVRCDRDRLRAWAMRVCRSRSCQSSRPCHGAAEGAPLSLRSGKDSPRPKNATHNETDERQPE